MVMVPPLHLWYGSCSHTFYVAPADADVLLRDILGILSEDDVAQAIQTWLLAQPDARVALADGTLQWVPKPVIPPRHPTMQSVTGQTRAVPHRAPIPQEEG